YTRTGRRFFDDPTLEVGLLMRLRTALQTSGIWDELATDWLVLDAELMPWSAKAQELIRHQYAAVGAAAAAGGSASRDVLQQAVERGLDAAALLARQRERATLVGGFVGAYQGYCWPVASLDDLTLAPFHILAGEGNVYANRDHVWHMQTLARIAAL